MRTFSRQVTTFDEVPPYFRARMPLCEIHARDLHRARDHSKTTANTKSGVDLKRRPPKSRPVTSPFKDQASFEAKSPIEEATRRDSAVHVSLSSYSPVKQPGTMAVPLSGEPESRRSLGPPIGIGSLVTEYQ